MKKYILPVLMVIVLASCGNSEKKAEGEAAETPREIEQAVMAGRSAARRVVNLVFQDSMQFHNCVLEANAEKSKYQIEHKPKCEAAFDSAFISTIRVTRPDLADKLQK